MARTLTGKPYRLYYVAGKTWSGEPRTVKTNARTPAEARDNALWTLKTAGRVYRGDAKVRAQ